MPLQGDRYEANANNLENAPDKNGIYELYVDDSIIYIGRADGRTVTIRSRLNDHKSGRDGSCTKVFNYYRREVTDNAAAREKQELAAYQRQHGGLPRCNERIG